MSVCKGTILRPILSTSSTEEEGSCTSISALHPDIIETQILPKLDGAALFSASCSNSSFYHLCSQDYLWFNACNATWPSTSTPLVKDVISMFPNGGPRAFFAQSYPLPHNQPIFSLYHNKRASYKTSQVASNSKHKLTPPPTELISAVDIHYKENIIFSKVEETETESRWFRCSPFRIDLLEAKDVVTTSTSHPENDYTCMSLMDDMSLSWILIDPIQRTAVNLSSHKPVSVNRHWLTGEVQVKFATVHEDPTSVYVECKVVVTCGRAEGGEMQVREVSFQVEDMEGAHLYGKDSLVILQRALKAKTRIGNLRADEARRKYGELLELKERRKEKKLKIEGALDVLSVGFGISIFLVFLWFMVCG